eukprot:15471925-Alexandrium_andersonii.AAC.1
MAQEPVRVPKALAGGEPLSHGTGTAGGLSALVGLGCRAERMGSTCQDGLLRGGVPSPLRLHARACSRAEKPEFKSEWPHL